LVIWNGSRKISRETKKLCIETYDLRNLVISAGRMVVICMIPWRCSMLG
jgi:hypothetical protein